MKYAFLLALVLFSLVLWGEEYDDLIKAGKFTEAIEIAQEQLDLNPNDLDWKIRLGYLYAWTGKYSQSETILTDVLKQNPDNYDAALGLSNCYLWSKKYQPARDVLQPFEKSNSADVNYHYALIASAQGDRISNRKYLRKSEKAGNKTILASQKAILVQVEFEYKNSMNNYTDDWNSDAERIVLIPHDDWNFGFTRERDRRYRMTDEQYGLVFNWKKWEKVKVSTEYHNTVYADFLARQAYQLNLYFPMKKYSLTPEFGYNYSTYAGKSSQNFHIGADYVFNADYSAGFKVSGSIDSKSSKSNSFSANIKYYKVKKNIFTLGYSVGKEAIDSYNSTKLFSQTLSVRDDISLSRRIDLSLGGSYYWDEKSQTRTELGGMIRISF